MTTCANFRLYTPPAVLYNGFTEVLKDEIEGAIRKAQLEFQSDIFGFGAVLRIKYPKTWQQIRENWNAIFSDTPINVTVKSSVVRGGKIKHPAKREATY